MNGRWCAENFPRIAGLHASDDGTVRLIDFILEMGYRGSRSVASTQGGVEIVQADCETKGQFPNICEWYCRRESAITAREYGRGADLVQTASMDVGDDLCVWTIRENPGNVEEGSCTTRLRHQLSEDQLDYWCRAGCAEHWANATSLTLSLLGEARGNGLLQKYARDSGESYAVFILESTSGERGPQLLLDAIDRLDRTWGATSRWETDLRSYQREVSECPFAGTPLVCAQVEAFWKGACAVLAPGWRVEYVSRKDRAEGNCKLRLTGP
jgi:hypothetical protein